MIPDWMFFIFGLLCGFLISIIIFAIVECNLQKERSSKDIKYYEDLLALIDEIKIDVPEEKNGNT